MYKLNPYSAETVQNAQFKFLLFLKQYKICNLNPINEIQQIKFKIKIHMNQLILSNDRFLSSNNSNVYENRDDTSED